jgi:hypothetical protein
MSRSNDETYTSYANRLTSALAYYIESRKATSYDLLVDLLICDRIKSNLTEGALRYVSCVENKVDGNWMRLAKMTESLDLFYDSHLTGDRPRYRRLFRMLVQLPNLAVAFHQCVLRRQKVGSIS